MSEKQADRYLGMEVSPVPRTQLAVSQLVDASPLSRYATPNPGDATKTFGGELTEQGDPISRIRFSVII